MPKPRNLVETVTITISTTPAIEERLERLVYTGLYGKNTAEAAERLLAATLERYELEGRLSAAATEGSPRVQESGKEERS
jgi:hypothetical protein